MEEHNRVSATLASSFVEQPPVVNAAARDMHAVVFHVYETCSDNQNNYIVGAESCDDDHVLETVQELGAENVLYVVRGVDDIQMASLMRNIPSPMNVSGISEKTRREFPEATESNLRRSIVAEVLVTQVRGTLRNLGLV